MWTYETTRSCSTVTTSSFSQTSAETVTETINGSGSNTFQQGVGHTLTNSTSQTGSAFDNTFSTTSQSQIFLSLVPSITYIDPTNSTNTLTGLAPANILVTMFSASSETEAGAGSSGSTETLNSTSHTVSGVTSSQVSSANAIGGTTLGLLSSNMTGSGASVFSKSGTTTTSFISGTSTGSTSITSITSSSSTQVFNGSSTQNATGYSFTNGTFSTSLTQANTVAYAYTTSTQSTTVNFSSSTTSTRESEFPNTTTISVTSTTTQVGPPTSTTTTESENTTTSSSSVDTFTSSTFTTASTTQIYTPTTSIMLTVCFDTIAVAGTTDWPWFITTTGSGHVDSLGQSFTNTTFSATMSGGSQACTTPTLDYSVISESITYTSTTYTTSSITSTVMTSSSSTYNVATAPTLSTADFPITNTTSTATISFTTTKATTYTYQPSGTTTEEIDVLSFAGNTIASSFTDTVTTTFSGGTSLSLLTYTLPEIANAVINMTQSVTGLIGSPQGTFTQVDVQGCTVASASTTLEFPQDFVTSGDIPSYLDTTIGNGWQAPSSIGASKQIGTNASASTDYSVALGWPKVSAPILTGTDTGNIQGAVQSTLVNLNVTSAIGGFSWNTSASTTITLSGSSTLTSTDTNGNPITVTSATAAGIWRATTCDSFSNTSITFYTTSILSIAAGHGIALETVPEGASSTSSDTPMPFMNFSAFPSS